MVEYIYRPLQEFLKKLSHPDKKILSPEEKSTKVNEFLDSLYKDGEYVLSKNALDGQKVILLFRRQTNPTIDNQGIITIKRFNELQCLTLGYTTAFCLDLLLENTHEKYEYIGFKHFKVADVSELGVIAKGNFSLNRSTILPHQNSAYQQALTEETAVTISSNGTELRKDFQNRKLGKFLIATQMLILKRLGVISLDLAANMTHSPSPVVPIYKKLGYSIGKQKLNPQEIEQELYQDWILRFLN